MSIAYWCILVAAILPYLTIGVAKGLGSYDNSNPRSLEAYSGVAQRANGAHQHGFEVFPLFAVAILVASAGSASARIPLLDDLALAWIVLRLLYTAVYLGNQASMRSVIWIVGLLTSVAIFTMPAWHR